VLSNHAGSTCPLGPLEILCVLALLRIKTQVRERGSEVETKHAKRTNTDEREFERGVYARVTWRLMPFLFLCYILAFVDRVNVGFAKLQMQQALGMTEAVYGTGAGIFFIGYFFFEVPANMILQRIGARLWIGPIMIVWGIVSSATMLVRNPAEFYVLRFLLGIVESGFFPGVILYLTFWYDRKHRAKMVAAFMSAMALSGVFGGPVSGWILSRMSGLHGLDGWQWLFLIEGIPSTLVGIVALFYLVDYPAKARWLQPVERDLLLRRLAEDEAVKKQQGHSNHSFADVFRSRNVWLLCLVYFGIVMSNYGISLWLPQIIKDTITKDPWRIGLISTIPWGVAAIVMIAWGHHSDTTDERRWHIAIPAVIGSVAFAISSIPGHSGIGGIAALTFATMGVMSANSTFWSLPASLLSGSAAAAGIAWINSVGNLAGYVSPFVIGRIRDATQSMTLALLFLSASCLVSGIIVIGITRGKR
jgi:D-galactonate transporter